MPFSGEGNCRRRHSWIAAPIRGERSDSARSLLFLASPPLPWIEHNSILSCESNLFRPLSAQMHLRLRQCRLLPGAMRTAEVEAEKQILGISLCLLRPGDKLCCRQTGNSSSAHTGLTEPDPALFIAGRSKVTRCPLMSRDAADAARLVEQFQSLCPPRP